MKTANSDFEIHCQPTPWDSNVFGVNTFEVSLKKIETSDIETATKRLGDMTSVPEPSLFYSRTNANNRLIKTVLTRSGFSNFETQLLIVNSINNHTVPKELGKRRLPIEIGNDQDYLELHERSSNLFEYSRFHEDPFVSQNLANLRMQLWCKDLHRQKVPLLVFKNKLNEIDSFVFYKKTCEKSVELILGGSMPGKGMLTPIFWASFIDHFKDLGIKSIETRISASNIGIANIYMFFDFKIRATFFDFHKHVNCNLLA
jgi:hypothetical protein